MAQAQPAVRQGEATNCIVSGATFVVEASSPHKVVGDRTFYFCCASCLAYFEEHQAEVLAKRGLAGT